MAEGADEVGPVQQLGDSDSSPDPVAGRNCVLDSLGDYSGSYRVGDGELDVPSDGYPFELILEVPGQVPEGNSEELGEE